MEEIQEKLATVFSELEEIQLDSIGRSVKSLIDGLSQLANSPDALAAVESLDNTLQNTNDAVSELRSLIAQVDTKVGPMAANLDSARIATAATLEEARLTFENLRLLLAPGSPLTYQLETALREFSAAASALNELVEYLERNPGALVRGREITEKQNE